MCGLAVVGIAAAGSEADDDAVTTTLHSTKAEDIHAKRISNEDPFRLRMW